MILYIRRVCIERAARATLGNVVAQPSPWQVTRRLASLRGEERANGLRVLGVAVFYAIEVLNHRGLELGPLSIPQVEGVDIGFEVLPGCRGPAPVPVGARLREIAC